MTKFKICLFLVATVFINGCTSHNAQNDFAYKKAVVKLVKKEKSEILINKDIIEFNKASK